MLHPQLLIINVGSSWAGVERLVNQAVTVFLVGIPNRGSVIDGPVAEWLTRERCIVSDPGSIPGWASLTLIAVDGLTSPCRDRYFWLCRIYLGAAQASRKRPEDEP